MDAEQCDFDELTALLSDEEEGMTGSAGLSSKTDNVAVEEAPQIKKECAVDSDSSDDDIDEDELDRLAALVEQGDNPPQLESNVQIKSEPVVKTEPGLTEEKGPGSAGLAENDEVASELKRMQERIKLLEAQIAESKKEPKVENDEKPAGKNTDKRPSNTCSKKKVTPPPPKSGQMTGAKEGGSSSLKNKSPGASKIQSKGPRVLKEIDFLSEICPSLPPAKKEASVKSPAAAKVVPQPPKRTKLTGDEPGVAAREENEAALVAQLFGDDDSDWEDLDGESNKSLSKEGVELQQLLRVKSNKGQRVAHQAAADRNFLNNRKPTWGSKAPALTKSPRGGGMSQQSQVKKEPEDPNVTRDPFSGIRIVNPLISSFQMRSRMENRLMVKMSNLHQKSKASLEGDWVTIGVLVHKTDPKTSQKGNQFSIWTLSDLVDCEHPVKMFLFGETHKGHWKTTVGTVVGLLNPSLMQNNEKYQNKSDELSITVDHPQKVMPMGTSKDLGFCKGKTKVGRQCLNFISKQSGEYCSYHIQSAYKKMSSRRSELQASHTGAVPGSLQKKLFPNKGSTINYGGASFGNFGGAATTEKAKKKVSVKSLVQHDSKANPGKRTTLSLHSILPEDLDKLKMEREAKEAKDHKAFHDMLSVPSAGSSNFVKHLIKRDLSDQASVASPGEKSKPAMKSISAKDLLKEHEKNMAEKRLQLKLKKEKQKHADAMIDLDEPVQASKFNPLSVVPKLGKGFMGGPLRARNTDAELAKKKAIFAIKEKGGIKKENPNAIKKSVSEESREKIRKRISSDKTDGASCLEEPPHKKSRLLGGLDPDDPEVKKLLAAKSRHAGQLTEMEMEKQEAYFSTLEKKEAMENKMMSITQVKCKAVTCKLCGYSGFSPLETCKEAHHNKLVWHDGIKRFFVCKDCKTRVVSLDRYPKDPCSGCGGKSFQKTSMMKEKKAKMAGEELNLRGEEIKYLNSLK